MVTQSIPLVANLRTQNRNIGTIYLATGLVTEGDTGGGIYFWNPSSTNADDGFYYLQVTGVATGRWVRIYAGSNIYNTDGSLLDNRDVTLNGNYLKFIGSSANSTFNADGTVTLGSLSGVNTRMVVAGATGTLATQSFVPGTTIRFVEKFSATLGQTVFNTTNTLYSDLFDVFLNGVKLNTDSFSFTANQITLIDGSYAGDIIDVVGFSSATVYASLPSQAGNAGKYLSTDGTNLSWETVSVAGFVPYTGATADVNLGEFGLSAGQLTLDVSPTGTAVVGTTRWNNTIGSSETTLKGGSVILKNGVDLVARVVNKVFPNATLTKAAYQAVRVSGAQGQRLAVAYAQANNDANSADTIGLVCETIATNQEGFIITVGQLENINTTGSLQGETWADGDVLYLSPTTPGAITKIKPTGNGHIVVIGYVEYAHANNGKIYVKVMNGWELEELHNVDIVTPANNEALIYESSTQLWKNKTIASALGYTPISGSGATGQVAYWNGTNSQTGSNNLFWDAANARLGIGTNTPSYPLHIVTSSRFGFVYECTDATASQNYLFIYRNSATPANADNLGTFLFEGNNASLARVTYGYFGSRIVSTTAGSHSGDIYFATTNAGVEADKLLLKSNGNLLIQNGGTFSDGGQRLQVYGNAYILGSGATSATNALLVQNSAGNDLFKVQNNGEVRISSISASIFPIAVNIFPNVGGTNLAFYSQTSTQVSTNGRYHFTGNQLSQTSGQVYNIVSASSFAPTSGNAAFAEVLLSTSIIQSGGANGITRGLYVNPTLTSAADWRSIEWSNNSGWGLYGAGTAPNFLGGNLTINRLQNAATELKIINTTSGTSSVAQVVLESNSMGGLAVFGKYSSTTTPYKILSSSAAYLFNGNGGDISILNDFATGKINFAAGASSTAQMTITAAGRLLLGTTTEGTQILQVQGTSQFRNATDYQLRISDGTYKWDLRAIANHTNCDLRFIDDSGVARVTMFNGYGMSIGNPTDGSSASLAITGIGSTSGSTSLLVKNSGSTAIFSVRNDIRVGIATNAPSAALDIWNATDNAQLRISDSRVTTPDYSSVGFNPIITNRTLGFLAPWSSGTGGLQFAGFSNANNGTPFAFVAYHAASPTTAAIKFIAFKHDGGTNRTALTGTEIIAGFSAGTNADVFQVKANGRINMSSLPTSSAGLSAGDLWNDAGTLKIV